MSKKIVNGFKKKLVMSHFVKIMIHKFINLEFKYSRRNRLYYIIMNAILINLVYYVPYE